MAELPLDQAIPRFKTNEERIEKFTNGTSSETVTASDGQQYPTIRKFLADKGSEIDAAGLGLLSQAQLAATEAEGHADDASGFATAAAATKDSYDQIWRGARTTDPATRPNGTPNQNGDQYFNTTLNKIFYFNGTQWVANNDTGFTIAVTPLTFNGSQTAFPLSRAPAGASNVTVEVNGVIQRVDTYTISGTTLTFSIAPPVGAGEARVFALTNSVVEPADESVSAGKIMSGAVSAIRTKLSVYSKSESDAALDNKLDKVATGNLDMNGFSILNMGSSGVTDGIPVGMMLFSPTGSIPAGYLEANGQTFSATTYPTLAAVYPSLAVPDMRDRVARHAGTLAGAAGTTQEDAFQGHRHAFSLQDAATSPSGGALDPLRASGATPNNSKVLDPITDGTNGAPRVASETRVKAYIGKYIIKAFGDVNNPGLIDVAALNASVLAMVRLGVRQTVMSGPIASGAPSFLPATSGSLSLTSQNISTGANALLVAAAGGFSTSGAVDVTGSATSNITWSSLAASTTVYLGVTVSGGALTTFSTTLAPIYQFGGTISVTNGQYTFDIQAMKMYLGNGTVANSVNAVFVGECVTGVGSVTSTVAYAYNGYYVSSLQAIPATATMTNFNHNVGVGPQWYSDSWVIECISTDAGYAVGEQTTIFNLTEIGAGYSYFIASKQDRKTSTISTSAVSFANIRPKSGGSGANLTSTKWNLRLSIKRGF